MTMKNLGTWSALKFEYDTETKMVYMKLWSAKMYLGQSQDGGLFGVIPEVFVILAGPKSGMFNSDVADDYYKAQRLGQASEEEAEINTEEWIWESIRDYANAKNGG